jgi:ribosome maturation factor RimP
MGVAERVRGVATPIATDLGLTVFDIEHQGSTVTVTLDRDGGIGVDELASATRLISRALDESDPVPGKYTLEVSSPGLERTLRTPEHFAWAVGREVSVRTTGSAASDAERRVSGVLSAADDDGITVTPADAGTDGGAESRTIAYDQIDRARTVFAWGPQPKPGGSRRTKGGSSKKQRPKKGAADQPAANDQPVEPR